MSEHLFDEMKRYVRFGPDDERALRELGPLLEPRLHEIIDDFYARIQEHPEALAVIRGGEEQVERLKRTLRTWLMHCFAGPWDDSYFQARARIGRRHVEIGLPQHYNFTAMDLIRQHLTRLISHTPGTPQQHLARCLATERLMDMELAIVLHTYREDYITQLKRHERLATFGQLSSTIGHELRNPLGVIESSSYLLRRRLGEDPAAIRHLDKIQNQVARSNRIITSMLDIVRDRPPSKTWVAPAQVVERAVESIREERGFEVQVRLPEALAELEVDVDQLHQILLNLLSNAVDAAGADGRVRVRGASGEGWIELVVEDSGRGVDTAIRERLFEPLVTTKDTGVGLGLALCRKLAHAHGGEIALGEDGELGGAAFVLRLPLRPRT